MNQILVTKFKKKNKKIFKIQFIISIIVIISLLSYYIYNKKISDDLEKISEVLNKNIKFSQMYNVEKQTFEKKLYLGKIIIEKINTEYLVFNNFNEELLKIAPCKFYGVSIGEAGNICIAGHNYNDDRFFSKLNQLELKDEIKLIDLKENKEFLYTVYDIFETEDSDVSSVIKRKKLYELTLLTCNNSNKKRIIIKAFLKE